MCLDKCVHIREKFHQALARTFWRPKIYREGYNGQACPFEELLRPRHVKRRSHQKKSYRCRVTVPERRRNHLCFIRCVSYQACDQDAIWRNPQRMGILRKYLAFKSGVRPPLPGAWEWRFTRAARLVRSSCGGTP